MAVVTYSTIKICQDRSVCSISIHRPGSNNTINGKLIEELETALRECERSSNVVVIEGSEDVFCTGLDFRELLDTQTKHSDALSAPERLYEIWRKLSTGSFISVAHVRGKVNAGGVGFAVSCDLVLAGLTVRFSLSELLFGLTPACVLPFLIRRVGWQRARFMTLTTRTVGAQQASEWGLVDAFSENSAALVASYLPRLRRLPKQSICVSKGYFEALSDFIPRSKNVAVETNHRMFADPVNRTNIAGFLDAGKFPWELE